MEQMRDMLRSVLGRSLSALSPLDRVSAAWPVAAGHGIAERSSVLLLNGTTVTVEVADAAWQRQLHSMAAQLAHDLARISRVPLTDILFVLPQTAAAPAPAKFAARQPPRRKRP